MLSMLRRYVGVVSVSSIIRNKFPPLTRFVSSSSSYASQLGFIPITNWSDPYNIPHPVETFNTLSSGVSCFKIMLSQGLASISDYNFIFENLAKIGSYNTVLSLFNKLDESAQFSRHHLRDVSPDIHTWAILISCHSTIGNMSSAISLFHKIIDTGHHPTPDTLYNLLEGFCRKHEIHRAMHFYNDIILKKGFQFDDNCYLILIKELCEIGETHVAIQLLRHALQIDKKPADGGFTLTCLYNIIIFRLCKDRLVNQAYDLYSEMIRVNNVSPNSTTYNHLIYGYCILGQFKEALDFFIEFEASRIISPTPPTLVTEQDVKSAKSVAAVMIKGGVKPNVASYHSVIDGLYKSQGGSRSFIMNKIAQKVETLLLSKPDKLTVNYD